MKTLKKTRTELEFDELNALNEIEDLIDSDSKRYAKAIPYHEYFGAMYISPEDMRRRIEFAEEIEDMMMWLFAYWIIAEEADVPIDEVKADAEEKLTSVVARHTILDPYLEAYIHDLIGEVVDVTEEHRKKKDEYDEEEEILDEFMSKEQDKEKEDYWLSQDRAMLISENEANAFDNYIDFKKAKAQGMTKKTWITELDDRVRLTHTLAEGQTVDIDGLFLVGGSKFRFPKDAMYEPSAREVVNCRCVCKYD